MKATESISNVLFAKWNIASYVALYSTGSTIATSPYSKEKTWISLIGYGTNNAHSAITGVWLMARPTIQLFAQNVTRNSVTPAVKNKEGLSVYNKNVLEIKEWSWIKIC